MSVEYLNNSPGNAPHANVISALQNVFMQWFISPDVKIQSPNLLDEIIRIFFITKIIIMYTIK